MNAILSDEQISALYDIDCAWQANRFQHKIVLEQARHLLIVLKERYTCGDKTDLAHGWIIISPEEYQKLLKECE